MEYFSFNEEIPGDCPAIDIYDGGPCFTGSVYENRCLIEVLQDCLLWVISHNQQYNYDSRLVSGTLIPAGEIIEFHGTAAICCTEVDLLGGDLVSKGNVYINGLPICDISWGDEEADVVCRNIGFDYGISTCCSHWGLVNETYSLINFDCDGGESFIGDCQYMPYMPSDYCAPWDAAGVICSFNVYWTTSKVVIVSVSAILTCICCLVMCCCYRFCKNNQGETYSVEVNMGEVNQKRTNTSLNSGTEKEGNTVSSGDVETYGAGRNEGEREGETSAGRKNTGEQDAVLYPTTYGNDTVTPAPPPPAWDAPPPYDPTQVE